MFLMTANPVLIAAAVIPAVILLIKVYKADRLEKEPSNLLISLIVLGIISTFIAIALETVGSLLLGAAFTEGGTVERVLMYFVVVGGSEEASKYILLKRKTWTHPAFNCQFDGVVYAVFVSLGFALWENIGYVIEYGMQTALLRAITAVPGHACFGVIMGVFYGLARRAAGSGKHAEAKRYRRLAFFMPAVTHGFYDFIATSQSALSTACFTVYIIIFFFICSRLVKKVAADDSYIVDIISRDDM